MVRYYDTKHWKELRAAALKRDSYRCQTPGCPERAADADHRTPRPKGAIGPTPADVLSNLISHCHSCHSRKTAMADGGFGNKRKGLARIGAKGCDADGYPLDPDHPWRSVG